MAFLPRGRANCSTAPNKVKPEPWARGFFAVTGIGNERRKDIPSGCGGLWCRSWPLSGSVFAAPFAGPGAPPISVEGQFLYNSNVAASSAAIAAERGLVRSDEIYTPSLDINYIKELGAETFMLLAKRDTIFIKIIPF